MIDYENVSNNGIIFINNKNLSLKDLIVIFIRTNECLSKDILKIINEYFCNFKIVKTSINQKNSVDFLISCYTLDSLNSFEQIYIISNDRGYETVKEYIKNTKNKNIILKGINNLKEESINNEIIKILNNEFSLYKKEVIDIIITYKNKNEIHNVLYKKHGEIGKRIYEKIKKIL